MKLKFITGVVAGLGLLLGVASQAQADAVYASYNGSQLGFTIRDVNTLNQYIWHDTGISASGIAVDSANNVYLTAANHIRKYDLAGGLLVDMTFPISSINYTNVAVNGNRIFATYNGSQLGFTIRNTSDLNQLKFCQTGVNASGIAVDASGNVYTTSGNHIRKYDSNTCNMLVDMAFPDARINYTSVLAKDGLVYATYTGSQQGVTKRDANTLAQLLWFNTGVNASGISLDASNNIYISAGNHLIKYSNTGSPLTNMTFPISNINYTGITIK